MKRLLSSLLSLSILLGSAGPQAVQAVAQVVPDVPSIGTGLGGVGGGVGASIGSPAGMPNAGPAGLNDPRFFVLLSLSTQLNGLSAVKPGQPAAAAKPMEPAALVRSVERILNSPETLANPNSPQAVSAKTLYHALRAPDRIQALSATLQSVHPEIGDAVSSQLQQTVRDFYAAGGNPVMLQGLGRAVDRIESLGPSAAAGVEGQIALDKVFIGPLIARGAADAGGLAPEADLRDAPAGLTVFAQAPSLALTLPEGAARLQPAPKKPAANGDSYRSLIESLPKNGEFSVSAKDLGAEDLGAALRLLDSKSAHDPNVSLLVRRLGDVNPDLPLDERRTFLFQRNREPELLKLLKIPDDAGGAARVLTDGRRSLSILIVSIPSEGITQTRLAEVLVHEAQHAADRGIFRIPTTEPLLHLLLEGYTQKRTQDRLIRSRAALGLRAEPNARYIDEVYLARSLIQAVGESPLRRLVRFGDDSELREALGGRWKYLKNLAAVAADFPVSEPRRADFFAALNQVLHQVPYSLSDFEAALARAFPDVPLERRARALLEVRGDAGSTRAGILRRIGRWYSDLVGRWSRPFRPDFDATRAPAATKWRRATLTFLALTAIYNSLLLASAWMSHGILLPFVMPQLMPPAAVPFDLLLHAPVVAAGEEAIFRVGVNGWMERALTRVGASPQTAALYAAVASSVLFAIAHVPAQGFDPVNLFMKTLFGLVAVHVYKKYGYGAAVGNHYLWNSLQTLAMALPFLTPLYVLLPTMLAVPALFHYATKRR